MKNHFTCLFVAGLMIGSSIAVSAQSVNSSLVISKDVQRVANKKAFANEELTKSNIRAVSQPFPGFVISKGVVQSVETEAQGNIASKGYPTWAISKGVARHNQQKTKGSPAVNTRDTDILTEDGISK